MPRSHFVLRMRRICGVGVAVTVTLLASVAQASQPPSTCPPVALPPSPAQIEEGKKVARDRGFLWSVAKAGKTSYLYGTVHIGKLGWMFPGPALLEAVRLSEVIALELDLLDPEIARRLEEGMALRPDRALPEALTTRLRNQLVAACLPEQFLTGASPEVVATTLTVMSARRDGLDPGYAIDLIYAGMARTLNKRVASLETPEQQLRLLLAGTKEEAQAAVESALVELESGRASSMVKRMAQVWSDGHLGELENYEKWCECADTEGDRAMLRRLLDQRNPGLASAIDAIHASGTPVFAAVGSLHMIGKLGLPALLAERGYKVERIPFKP